MATELEDNIRLILTEKDEKILPENIKKDVSILGVTGNYEGEYNAKIEDYNGGELYHYITKVANVNIEGNANHMFSNFWALNEIKNFEI